MFSNLFTKLPKQDKAFHKSIQGLIGCKPSDLQLYKLATQQGIVDRKTRKGIKESYERLEYLGDAVLGVVIAEFLFYEFPDRDEGFLTEMRSKIVKRDSLNELAKKTGISKLIKYNKNQKNVQSHKSIHGNTLESIVGATYIDKGHVFCKRFIINKLIKPNFDMERLVELNTNYKSIIIEWAQSEDRKILFETIEEVDKKHYKEFTAQVVIDGKAIAQGSGYTKKKAEQNAAKKSCDLLLINI